MPMVKFTPSPEQREVVAALSASKMPLEKIAASIINPRTQRAISVKTLGRMFKQELKAGVETIVEAYRGLRAALEAKEPWAVRYALDHVAEFKAQEKEVSAPQNIRQEITEIVVRGIPSPYANEPEEPPPPDYYQQLGSSPRLLNLAANPPRLPKPEHVNKFAFEREDDLPKEEPPKPRPVEPSPDQINRAAASNSAFRPKNRHWMG